MKSFLRIAVAMPLVIGLLTACGPSANQPEVNDAPQPAQDPKAIRIEIPGQSGALVVSPPPGSRLDETSTKTIGNQEAVVARITTPGGIILQATILGPTGLYPGFGTDQSLKARLTEWRDAIEPQLLEGPRAIEPFPGDNSHGFYTLATIDLAVPEAKNYILNGYFIVGDHVVMIGGQHDDDRKLADEQILEIIRTVRWEDSPS